MRDSSDTDQCWILDHGVTQFISMLSSTHGLVRRLEQANVRTCGVLPITH